MSRIPLLIDTDVALGVEHDGRPRDIDDGFAMVEAMNVPDLELLGVTTVYGNAPHQAVHRVAREIVALKAADVPVVAGATEALPQTGELPPANDAVAFLAAALRERPAHIAAIGPLTNIGALVRHHPDVLDNVLSVIAVAGRSEGAPFYIGEQGPVRDFNFENDPRAARLLLEAGVPVVLAGFELTSQVAVTEQDLEVIRQVGSETAAYFHRNSLAWCRYWTRMFPADAGFHPWDSAAIAWLRHPEYFATEERGWRIREVEVAPPVGALSRARSGLRRLSRSGDRSYGGERGPHSGERDPHSGERGPHSGKRRFHSGERGPHSGERRSHGGERGSHSGERSSHSRERPTPWLETDPDYPGNRVTYCTGFAAGGAAAFVRDVVTTVY